MNFDDAELKAEDHAYRRAALTYFSEKGALARTDFDGKQLQSFLSFEEHWKEFFAPSDPETLREYLTTPFEIRKSQFERFKRECRAWEVSFQHCTRATARSSETATAPPASASWTDLKRRIEAQRHKAAEVQEFYSNLDHMLDRERQRRSHPIELLAHFRVLGIPEDATLEDVKKQYRQLARQHHPDRLGGDALRMGRITDAYRAIVAYYKVA